MIWTRETSAPPEMRIELSRLTSKRQRLTKFVPVLHRVTICFVVVASILGNPLRVLCVEDDGGTAVESAWFLCCVASASGDSQTPVSSTQFSKLAEAPNCSSCLDISLAQRADHSRRNWAQAGISQLCVGVAELRGEAHSQLMRLELVEPMVTVGHSGSDLAPLSSVRLLT